MSKEVFEESLDQILEFDPGLDINAILANTPAIETEIKKPETKEETKSEDKLEINNINKVLEKAKEDEVVETKVEEKIEEKAPVNLDKKPENTSDASFTVIFARDLVEQGLLSSFDEAKFLEESKTLGEADALRALIKNEIDANITAAKSDLDTGYQEYLSLIGKGVPQETAGSLVELKTKFEGIKADELKDDSKVELRKSIMTDYFKLTTSMSDAKIEKLVQSSVDLGEDVEDSTEYLNTLKGLIKEQITSEEKVAENNKKLLEEENRRSIESLKENINSLNEIIPGVAINKQTKNQMFEAITKPVTDKQGRTTNSIWALRAEDPMFFDERLSYLFATGYFVKGKTWDKAGQAKVTKEISALEQVLKSKNNTESGVGKSVIRTMEQDKTTKDNIDSMRGIFGK